MPASKEISERIEKITKDELYQYFITENHSTNETAEHFNIAHGTVGNLCKKFGIKKHKDKVLEKRRSTCLLTYGVDAVFKVPAFQEQYKQTCLQKYGVENISQADSIKEKKRILAQEKYGVDCVLAAPEIRARSKKTMLKKYGVDNIFKTPESKSKACLHISKNNLEFARFLEDVEFEFYLHGYSYDLRYKNILIDINPYIWHNVCYNPRRCDGKPREYQENMEIFPKNAHILKRLIANREGYICIQIFDWMDYKTVAEAIKSGNYELNVIPDEHVQLHWWNPKTKDHVIHVDQNKQEMWEKGYYPIYDDGQIFTIVEEK